MTEVAGIDAYLAELGAHLTTLAESVGTAVPTVIRVTDEVDLLAKVKHALDKSATELVTITSNACSPEAALAMLLGTAHPGGSQPQALGSPVRLDGLLRPLGLRPLGNIVVPGTASRPSDGLLGLLNDVSLRAGMPGDAAYLARRYRVEEPLSAESSELAPELAPDPAPDPALTVLVRTQGQRPQALADALLSLAGQTCMDFEVLLLCHNPSDEGLDGVRRLVESFGPFPSRQVRVIEVNGPGRAAPLNAGVASARGRHIAFLDDDDVVLGHWVESFVAAGAEHPTSVLRARVAEQDMELSGGAAPGFRASSQARSPWNREFDLLDHWVDNHSPINGYAYPAHAFRDLGFRFDDTLPVLEDWSLLLQVASICGVVSIAEFTAIYRRWPAAETSFAELPEAEWRTIRTRVLAGLDARPWIVPRGFVSRAREAEFYRLTHRPFQVRLRDWLGRRRAVVTRAVAPTPLGPPARWAVRQVRVVRGRRARSRIADRHSAARAALARPFQGPQRTGDPPTGRRP